MSWTVEKSRLRYCPDCGNRLGTNEKDCNRRLTCERCESVYYRNPVPMARATVIDGDSALLIERGQGADQGAWALPGGHVEWDEPPAVAAVRELEEETGLAVSPDDLSLLGTGFLEFEDGHTMISTNYAAPFDVVSGRLDAGSDASDARFWSREELRTSTPLLRASGLAQVLEAIERHGRTK